jgi:hypothetical protein
MTTRSVPARRGPRNIFVGTSEAGGFVMALAAGFRALGNPVTTAMCTGLTHYGRTAYDVDVGEMVNQVDWTEVARRLLARAPRIPRVVTDRSSPLDVVLWLLYTHDVFVFLYTSLWHDVATDSDPFAMGLGREFRLLKKLGKQVVVVATGFDVRHVSAMDQQLARFGHRGPRLAEDAPSAAAQPLARPLRNLRRAERWADLIVSQPNMAGLAVRPYMHLFAPVDVRGIRATYTDRELPVVVHAPSHFQAKGTVHVLAALAELQRDHVDFTLRLFHRIPHAAVLDEMRRADVVIDQVHMPHGCVGVEAMATGCALASADNHDLEPWPKERPIWPIEPGTAREQLRRLFQDRELRMRLAREGRAHAMRHHDQVAVARSILARLDAGRAAPMDHHPDFFVRHYRLAPGVVIPKTLQRMTTRILRRCGLPPDVDPQDLVARGLLADTGPGSLNAIPRWSERSLKVRST